MLKLKLEAGVRLSHLFLDSSKSGGNKGYTVAEPVSSVHGIFQAIVLEWISISFSRGSS